MDNIGPLAFTGIRFLLGAMAVAPFAYWEWKRSTNPIPAKGQYQGIFVGVIFFIATIVQQYGFLTTTVTNAGFLTALYVILDTAVEASFCSVRHRTRSSGSSLRFP